MDARSEKTLATLHPSAVSKFREFLTKAQVLAATKGLEYIAICGIRSWEEQEALYAKGRTAPGPIVTKAKPGSSMHNYGLAIDCGVFRDKKYLDESDEKTADAFHRQAAAIARECGLRWGGDFKTIYDAPHFELNTPITVRELAELRKPGQWVRIA